MIYSHAYVVNYSPHGTDSILDFPQTTVLTRPARARLLALRAWRQYGILTRLARACPAEVPTLHGLLLRAQVEQHWPLRQTVPLVNQPLLQLAEPVW